MKRSNWLAVFFTVLALVSIIACARVQELPISELPQLNNDLANGTLVLKTPMPEEGFTFVREYSTSYNAKNWRITDSKSLVMKAWVEGSSNKVVLIEHVHADVALKSRYESLDGWSQDSMDDRLHTGSQPGFWITEKHPWEEVFAIEGFSQTLISGWGFFFTAYGSGEIIQQRLTEENLVKYGKVYGNKIQIVYDLLIKSETDPYFYTRSVIDEFLVPTGQPLQLR